MKEFDINDIIKELESAPDQNNRLRLFSQKLKDAINLNDYDMCYALVLAAQELITEDNWSNLASTIKEYYKNKDSTYYSTFRETVADMWDLEPMGSSPSMRSNFPENPEDK